MADVDSTGGPLDDLSAGAQVLARTERGVELSALPASAFENLLVVSVTQTPARIESTVVDAGGDPADVGVIPVTGSQTDYSGPMWTSSRVDPSDLTGLSMRLSEASRYLNEGRGWVVMDNLTVLLMYAPVESVYRFVTGTTNGLREKDVRGVFGIVEAAMSDQTAQRFQGVFDDVVDL